MLVQIREEIKVPDQSLQKQNEPADVSLEKGDSLQNRPVKWTKLEHQKHESEDTQGVNKHSPKTPDILLCHEKTPDHISGRLKTKEDLIGRWKIPVHKYPRRPSPQYADKGTYVSFESDDSVEMSDY